MAIPPDPIEEVLPQAHTGVVATVTQLVHREKQKAVPEHEDPSFVGSILELPAEIVQLQIKEVLFGSLVQTGQTLEVLKPPGEYALREGVEGPFLLRQEEQESRPLILGLYGPDTYTVNTIRQARNKLNLP